MWKKHPKTPKRPLSERLSRSLELPLEVLENLPEIELRGNREAVVGHCRGILEYNDRVVRIAAEKMVIKFAGRNLQLSSMTEESVIVTGFFTGVEFL